MANIKLDEMRPPNLERHGLGNYNETAETQEIRRQVGRFAREVMRPTGIALDRLRADEVIAQASPIWEYLDNVKRSGLFELTAILSLTADEQREILPAISEELGWGDVGLGLLNFVSGFTSLTAASTGDRELIDRFANTLGCWVGSQPDRGSDVLDLAGMATYPGTKAEKGTLTVKKSGEDYIIQGQSSAWISGAPIATAGVLYAACDYGSGFYADDDKLNYVGILVPFDEPGVRKGEPLEKLGQRSLPQGELFFDSVRLPARYVIAGREHAYAGVNTTVMLANLNMGMTHIGLARAAFEYALDYVHERKQGGVPLIRHQNVGARIFSMWQKLEVARALSTRVVNYHFGPLGPHSIASIGSKTFVTETTFEIAREALNLFGANGLSRGYPIEKLSRDAQTSLIEDGENNFLHILGGAWLGRWHQEIYSRF